MITKWHNQYGPVGALMDLERMGLVSKKIYPEIPPRVDTICEMPMAKELEVLIRVWPVG